MGLSRIYNEINDVKFSFDDVYNNPDPRGYFSTLGALDYMIPQNAKPVFEAVIAALRDTRDQDTITVLDIGCSYGVNAALLKHGFHLNELYALYGGAAARGLDQDALLARDRALLSQRGGATSNLRMIGLDVAGNAVTYGTEAGYLDAGIVANLEAAAVRPAAAAELAGVDLIISTGCIGYVTARTFAQVLDSVRLPQVPWIASFVLRMFPFDPIAAMLSERGYATERLEDATFIQRRFASEDERRDVLRRLDDRGVAHKAQESRGAFHAEFFLSRPEEDVAAVPLRSLAVDWRGVAAQNLRPGSDRGSPAAG